MRRDWIDCASFSRRPKVTIQVHTIMMNKKGVDTFFFTRAGSIKSKTA